MATTQPSGKTVPATNDARAIESGRYERACTESMTCERVADRFYEVHSSSGNTYDIDLQTGACSCPDSERRGDRLYCKHAIRSALVEIYADKRSSGVTSAVGAIVASYAREGDQGCPSGNDRLCDGPLGPRLPYPACMDAVCSEDVDEFDVWTLIVRRVVIMAVDWAGSERTCGACRRYHPTDVRPVMIDGSIRFRCIDCRVSP